MKKSLKSLCCFLASIVALSSATLCSGAVSDRTTTSTSFEVSFCDIQGENTSVKIVETDLTDLPEHVVYEAYFEIEPAEYANQSSANIIPTIVTGTMKISERSHYVYDCTLTYNTLSLTGDYMTDLAIGVYRDYPDLLATHHYSPNTQTFSVTVPLVYIRSGTYTVKVFTQVTTAQCGLLASPVSSGTRTVVILDED